MEIRRASDAAEVTATCNCENRILTIYAHSKIRIERISYHLLPYFNRLYKLLDKQLILFCSLTLLLKLNTTTRMNVIKFLLMFTVNLYSKILYAIFVNNLQ